MNTGIALSMYADEPCRICGRLLTMDDVKADAVFVGYSKDGKSRAAHKLCWDNANEILPRQPRAEEYKYAVTMDDGVTRYCNEWSEVAELILNSDGYMHITIKQAEENKE